MLPANHFRLIGLTWGESDKSEILRPNREKNGENGDGNGQVSPMRWDGNGTLGRTESLCPHADNDVFNVSDFGNEWERMLSHRRLSAE